MNEPHDNGEGLIEVTVHCPNEATAAHLAALVVGERLAAAANIHPAMASCYRWQGAIETADEVPLTLKTRQSLFAPLAKLVAEHHPYKTPCIIAGEIRHAAADYRRWIIAQTRSVPA